MRTGGSYIGLRNGGATCYMNAVLQQLFMQPRIRELVLGARMVSDIERPDNVFCQLQVRREKSSSRVDIVCGCSVCSSSFHQGRLTDQPAALVPEHHPRCMPACCCLC